VSESVSKSAFKPRALEFFRRIQETGLPLIITDHGKPVLKIAPYSVDRDETLLSLRESVIRYDAPEDPVAVDEWEALK
jgi:antitoxin (DNA-binding transcriptional repressor) of toxin-antitoxin stability system